MADDMLISFESPAPLKAAHSRAGLRSPLIPCPSMPFDCVASEIGDDPFEIGALDQYAPKRPPTSVNPKPQTPERSCLPLDGTVAAGTPSPLMLRRAVSDVDISGRFLVSSTPLVSNANTPTRSQPRRSVRHTDESISCALVKSKLDFINKVNQNLTASKGNPMNKWKSNPNLYETLDTSVQHKIFSYSKGITPAERTVVPRGRASSNNSPMNSTNANRSFMLDQEELPVHETSAFKSFFTSPAVIMVDSKLTPTDILEGAKKMELLFTSAGQENYVPAKQDPELNAIEAEPLPDCWFDDSLYCDDLQFSDDSDEDVKKAVNDSKPDTLDAIKARLNRIRRFSGCEDSSKETKQDGPPVKSSPAPVPSAVAADVPPVVAPELLVPKLPPVPDISEIRHKPTVAPGKRGPLKAVEPVPNMIKRDSKTNLLKVKN